MLIDFKKFLKTAITVKVLDANKEEVSIRKFQNTITYVGADLIAESLLGVGTSRISHLYAFFNARGGAGLATTAGDAKATTRNTFVENAENGSPGTDNGALWVPISSNTNVTASTNNYSTNQITYYFSIPSSAVADDSSKLGELIAETSEIRAIGLAVGRHPSDRTKDQIFSVIDIPEAEDANNRQVGESFVIPAAGQVDITYTLTFQA